VITNLSIRNLALIDRMTVDFSAGFSVITGETGAGKSVLLGAIGQLLGERAGADIIRDGEDKAIVEGRFDISALDETASFLARKHLQGDGRRLTIRKEIYAGGKSKCYINSQPVNLSILKELGTFLVDIHGQHDHQSLFQPDYQRHALDLFAGLSADVRAFTDLYHVYRRKRKRLDDLNLDEKERLQKIDLLTFAVNEITDAALADNEDSELERELTLLSNYEKIYSAVGRAVADLKDGEPSAYRKLDDSVRALEEVRDFDNSYAEVHSRLETLLFSLEDIVPALRETLDGVEFSPERLDEIQARLNEIGKLKRKYGDTIAEINAYAERSQRELDSVSQSDDEKKQLSEELDSLRGELSGQAHSLTEKRQTAARKLEARIKEELSYLQMEKTKFIISIEQEYDEHGFIKSGDTPVHLTPYGIDSVEFLMSTNLGEPTKPLRKIASGGEISRIMLAVKTVLNREDDIPTLIFDEIDTGVGGRVAELIGNKLDELGRTKQVFCITHQHQLAACARSHFYVNKQIINERTFSRMKRLNREERTDELARMLGGADITELTRQHARELLEKR